MPDGRVRSLRVHRRFDGSSACVRHLVGQPKMFPLGRDRKSRGVAAFEFGTDDSKILGMAMRLFMTDQSAA